MEIHLSLAVCIIVWMELDGFQTLLQQCLILCSTLPYSGGRDHGDQRPKACKHEWDQSLWMTSTVRMEIKHHSFRFVRLSGPFYSPNPCDLELCLPHLKLHPAAYYARRAHLMVTTGMSGFSAWFVPNVASCNRSYSRWANVSQTSSGWTDTRRHRVHAEIQPLLQQRGEPGVKCLWEKQSQHGTKATTSYANRVVSWRGGSWDHYPRGLNVLFWHVEYIPQHGTRETRGQ